MFGPAPLKSNAVYVGIVLSPSKKMAEITNFILPVKKVPFQPYVIHLPKEALPMYVGDIGYKKRLLRAYL